MLMADDDGSGLFEREPQDDRLGTMNVQTSKLTC